MPHTKQTRNKNGVVDSVTGIIGCVDHDHDTPLLQDQVDRRKRLVSRLECATRWCVCSVMNQSRSTTTSEVDHATFGPGCEATHTRGSTSTSRRSNIRFQEVKLAFLSFSARAVDGRLLGLQSGSG